MKLRVVSVRIFLGISIMLNIATSVLLVVCLYQRQWNQHDVQKYWEGVMAETVANAAHEKNTCVPRSILCNAHMDAECELYISYGHYAKAIEVGTRELQKYNTSELIQSRALAYELSREFDKAITDYQFIGTFVSSSDEDALDLESSLARLYFKKGDTASAYHHYKKMVTMVSKSQIEFYQENRFAVIRGRILMSYFRYRTELIPFHNLAKFASFYEAEAQKDPSQNADTQTALQIVREMMEQEKQGGIDLKY